VFIFIAWTLLHRQTLPFKDLNRDSLLERARERERETRLGKWTQRGREREREWKSRWVTCVSACISLPYGRVYHVTTFTYSSRAFPIPLASCKSVCMPSHVRVKWSFLDISLLLFNFEEITIYRQGMSLSCMCNRMCDWVTKLHLTTIDELEFVCNDELLYKCGGGLSELTFLSPTLIPSEREREREVTR